MICSRDSGEVENCWRVQGRVGRGGDTTIKRECVTDCGFLGRVRILRWGKGREQMSTGVELRGSVELWFPVVCAVV